eukprot:634367-Hanusia_phi.AAC.1
MKTFPPHLAPVGASARSSCGPCDIRRVGLVPGPDAGGSGNQATQFPLESPAATDSIPPAEA